MLAVAACSPSPAPDGATPATVDGAPALLGRGDIWGPWQAQPIDVGPQLRLKAEQACRDSMQPFPAAPLVVLDARGGGVLQAQFANGTGGAATCMDMTVGRDGSVSAIGGGMTTLGGVPVPVLAPFTLESQGGMASGGGPDGGNARTLTSGRVGPGIAAVVIDVPGKGRITASLENGWYLAWYPGDWPEDSKVHGLDVTGAIVAEGQP